MKKRNFFQILIFSIFTFLLISPVIVQSQETFTETDDNDNLRLGNDYIVIVINQDKNAQGRFAIETTGGAPLKEEDEEKPLVYGRPKPWTSYTTLMIDEKPYIFGGKTGRRAGRDGNYGKVVQEPEVEDNKIVTTSEINNIEIKQILSIVKSSTTGLFDTVNIEYEVTNNSSETRDIGLRLMLDTMLGENDGAPFRIGEEAVDTDTILRKDELPNFWQAFDSISDPSVTAQGTFKGPEVTTPDKVNFADWGSLADGSWDFEFNSGEEFMRKGEYEVDSAIALYWNQDSLKPDETRTYSTRYGLGGITVVPGLLSLGISSPAEFTFTPERDSFPVVAYIENTSEINAENVTVNLNLPDNLTTDEKERNLGDMEPGDINQVTWNISPEDLEDLANDSQIKYSVEVNADNTDSNQVNREMDIYGPPNLEVNLKSQKLNKTRESIVPNPFEVTAEIENTGGSALKNSKAILELPPGLNLASREKNEKLFGELKPGENIETNWKIKALSGAEGELPFVLNVEGSEDFTHETTASVEIPEISPLIYLDSRSSGENEEYIILDLKGVNLEEVNNYNFAINFDKENFKPLKILPGNIFVENDNLVLWEEPEIEENLIKFENDLPGSVSSGNIASVVFKILNDETFQVDWDEFETYDNNGESISVEKNNLTKQIEVNIE